MANEKIDVKAEAEEIELEVRAEMRTDTIQAWIVQRIESLASRVRAEAKREQIERDCAAVCDACDLQTPGVSHSVWCDRIRQAFAETGNCSELPDSSTKAMRECNHCDKQTRADKWGGNVCPMCGEINTKSGPDTLRQFVDAAVELADSNGCDFRGEIEDCKCSPCTILRLAPQFREKK
jgi:hypothetical protein